MIRMNREHLFTTGVIVIIAVALNITASHSYLLFHAIIEVCSIIIACSVFLLVWNSREYIEDSHLLILGVAFLFVACLDLIHTFSYEGMGFFKNEVNTATQLWIAARYIQSLSFLISLLFIGRKLNIYSVFMAYQIIVGLLLSSIFYWSVFPDCYIPGEGLTHFKIASEYIISVILFMALAIYVYRKERFDAQVFKYLSASLLTTIFSELAFTHYVSVIGLSNQIGHFLKLIAFYLIYKAIIETGLIKPLNLLFKDLKEREAHLKENTERLEQEIKERISIEKQLEESHLTINQIFNGTADSIRVVGSDYGVLKVNQSFLDYVGATEENSYNLPCHKLFFGPECFTDRCTLTQIMNGAESVESEVIKTDLFGIQHELHMIAKPYRDANGKLLGIIESFKDISRRKEMERTIHEERDLFIDGFVVIFKWINQPGWPVAYVSPNVERVLGYTVDQISGSGFRYTDIIDPQDQNRVIQRKSNAISLGQEHEEHDPYRIKDSKGETRWIMDHTRFVMSKDGKVDYFYGYLLDVSNYKATEERLEHQAKLAHAGRLTSLGEMASGMAHELNQPLTVIRLAADGIKSSLAFEPDKQVENEAVDDIISQVKRAAKIIRNMRAFSRTDSIGYQSINLAEPIENAISFFREQFRTHEITLAVDISEDLPRVLADPQKFEQIIVNLLSNSRFAVESKKEYAASNYEMRVSVRAFPDTNTANICFEVEDNGISMSPETLDRCMEPFFTQKDIGEGTGLGLSIVNNIAREFGMSVDIDRLDGEGCLIRITIPVPSIT